MGKLDKLNKKIAAKGIDTALSKQRIRETELAQEAVQARAVYQTIALNAVQLNPANDYNRTDNEEEIAQLADGIRKNGLLHNIVVSARADGSFVLLSGERRVRALRMLQADPEANAAGEYDKVHAKVISGLDALDELIILDEANLLARGTPGSEAVVAAAIKRYMANLQKKYGVTAAEAQAILMKKTTLGERTVYRYLQIERDLIPALGQRLEKGEFARNTAVALCGLEEDGQQQVADALAWAEAEAGADNLLRYRAAAEVLKRAVAAAELSGEAQAAALAGLRENLMAFAPKTPVTADEATRAKKAQYIAKYEKMTGELHKLAASKAKVRTLKRLEEADAEGSIVATLEALRAEVEALLEAMA